MRSRFSLFVVFHVLMLGIGTAASAQSRPGIFVTPIPDVPFSGMVNVERTIVQPNGAVVNLRTIRAIGRDNLGRIHNEARALVSLSQNQAPPVMSIHLYDPRTRTNVFVNPQQRTYWVSTVNHPPSTEPPDYYASPSAVSFPVSQYAPQEDLGNRDIAGLPAHGVRATQTIPAEGSGTGKEVVITDEYWYSEDLRMNLMIRHNDPRTGSVTMTVTQITRTEPALSFFEIPEGYKAAVPDRNQGREQNRNPCSASSATKARRDGLSPEVIHQPKDQRKQNREQQACCDRRIEGDMFAAHGDVSRQPAQRKSNAASEKNDDAGHEQQKSQRN